jgi:hypothetical protein
VNPNCQVASNFYNYWVNKTSQGESVYLQAGNSSEDASQCVLVRIRVGGKGNILESQAIILQTRDKYFRIVDILQDKLILASMNGAVWGYDPNQDSLFTVSKESFSLVRTVNQTMPYVFDSGEIGNKVMETATSLPTFTPFPTYDPYP